MRAIEQSGAHDARNGAVKHDEGAGVSMTGQEPHMARCRQPGMPTAASAPAECMMASAMLSMAQGYQEKTVSLMSGAVQSASGAQVNEFNPFLQSAAWQMSFREPALLSQPNLQHNAAT